MRIVRDVDRLRGIVFFCPRHGAQMFAVPNDADPAIHVAVGVEGSCRCRYVLTCAEGPRGDVFVLSMQWLSK